MKVHYDGTKWTTTVEIRGQARVFTSTVSERHLLEQVDLAKREKASYELNAEHFEADPPPGT